MKKECLRTIGFLLALLSFATLTHARTSPIIIDHLHADISRIPVAAIENAKRTIHIAYEHSSHGSQLISGMGVGGFELDNFLNNSPRYNSTISGIFPGLYFWNNGGVGNALDLHDNAMSGWLDLGYYPQWENDTRSYLDAPENADVNVVVWAWCGQLSYYSEQTVIDTYLTPMAELENDYPDVTFVYMTGRLDGSGPTGIINQRNEQIREFCRINNKVLYDFADIESFDPDGLMNYMLYSANDNCDYDSDNDSIKESNWAIAWQNNHIQGVDWWPSGAAHSQHLNGNLKGYAAWSLWAQIAGWNVCDYDGDGDVDGDDLVSFGSDMSIFTVADLARSFGEVLPSQRNE